jgi:hypothetical protein
MSTEFYSRPLIHVIDDDESFRTSMIFAQSFAMFSLRPYHSGAGQGRAWSDTIERGIPFT